MILAPAQTTFRREKLCKNVHGVTATASNPAEKRSLAKAGRRATMEVSRRPFWWSNFMPLGTSFRPATHTRRWWALGVVGAGQLLIVVDATIVSVAMPSIQAGLGMTDSARQWTVTGYTLAFGSLLLLGGRLADRFGRKNTLLAGMIGFAVVSALGGAATTSSLLIAARVAQGAFAALLAPSTLSMLSVCFTEAGERTRAFAIYSAITMSGAAVGLIVGGALTGFLDWRWCLYVNLPIGLLAAIAGAVVLPTVHRRPGTRLDWWGALLITLAVGTGTYGLTAIPTEGWTAPSVLVLSVTALVTGCGFVIRQARGSTPLLPLSIVTDRARMAAYLSMGGVMFGMFGTMLILTYQLQDVMGYDPLSAGLAFLPLVISNVIVSTQISRRLFPVVGARPLLVGGLLLQAAGLLVLSSAAGTGSYWGHVGAAELILGCGGGLTAAAILNTSAAGVSPDHLGVAWAFLTTTQLMGSSAGVACLNAVATLVASRGGPDPRTASQGYAAAALCAAAVLTAAAVIVALVAPGRVGVRRRPA